MTNGLDPRFRMLAIAGALIIAAGGGFWLGTQRAPESDAAGAAQEEKRVLYWYDPMVPDQHFDKPGKSPFMDMQLVPRYAGEAEEAGVRIDPAVTQNLGLRIAVVESAPLARSVTAAGALTFNERKLAIVQARAGGFVERTYGRAVGDVVAAGAPLVDIRVPEWAGAQAEYLALRKSGDAAFAQAGRQRLLMLGMPNSLVERIEKEGKPRPVTTVESPITGAITKLDIRTGMTVAPGAPLATINALSPVWLVASLPQADASAAKHGGRVIARTPAFPGEIFAGRIESVLPAADPETRTIEVRIALANPQGRLRPGMTADVEIAESQTRAALTVPAEALIRTGRRTVVIVALDNDRFAPTEVEIGSRAGDRIEIRSGLAEGQRVVASGQFLIDSEASLSGALERLQSSAQTQPDQASASHEGSGRVAAVSAESITIAHGPVASINWPAMTMGFQLERADLARGLRVGDTVSFRFRQERERYIVTELRKTEARR